MPSTHTSDRIQAVRDCFTAYETDDRDLLESRLAPTLVFSAPPDVGLDRTAYFERCWANRQPGASFHPVRFQEIDDDEVLITYEATRPDGTRFRNTELHHFTGDLIDRVEVYFGWDLD